MRFSEIVDGYAVAKENRRGYKKNRSVDQKCEIEGDQRVHEVESQRLNQRIALARDHSRLHECRMQIQIVRHDGCAENADCNVKARAIDLRSETVRRLSPVGLDEIELEREARR